MMLLPFFFLLYGCQPSQEWQFSALKEEGREYSKKFSYSPQGFHGISVSITFYTNPQGEENAYTYLEVSQSNIPPYQSNPKEAKISMKVEEKIFQGIAFRHQGGQRLTLPSLFQELLLRSLKNNQPVTFLLEGYESTVEPYSFSEIPNSFPDTFVSHLLQLIF